VKYALTTWNPKKNAGKLQLIINKYNNKLKIIRNSKLSRKSIHQNQIRDEIIQKKTSELENSLKQIENKEIQEILKDPEDLEKLINLDNLEEEIYEEKLLKKELFKDKKNYKWKKNF
jgi:glutaredoxin 2